MTLLEKPSVSAFVNWTLPALALLAASPVMAQEAPASPDEKINQLIIYGDDKCPESKGDEIVVCARLKETERFRIPKTLRNGAPSVSKDSWTNRVQSYEYAGASGTMSCSPTGAGGYTGCGLREINEAYAEKRADPGIAFGRLIAEERKKRLAGIDAEAEAVEQRIKQFEAEREQREAKEAEAQRSADARDAAGADSEPLPEPK
jgi:hypothetical protein